MSSTFTVAQKRELVAALRTAATPNGVEDVIASLEPNVVSARRGDYKRPSEKIRFMFACQEFRRVYSSLDVDVQRTVANICGEWFRRVIATDDPPDRRRGRPPDRERASIAAAVGKALLTCGVRSRRRLRDPDSTLPRSSDGWYARVLSVVLSAAGKRPPVDVRPLISDVAPFVEGTMLVPAHDFRTK